MSKRLRSPLRTALRGRNLRPKATQPRAEPLAETVADHQAVLGDVADSSTEDRFRAVPTPGEGNDAASGSSLGLAQALPPSQAPLPAEQTPLPEPTRVADAAFAPERAAEAMAATATPIDPLPEPVASASAPIEEVDSGTPPSSIRERVTLPEAPRATSDPDLLASRDDAPSSPLPQPDEARIERAHDDELGTSLSLSAEFFRQDEDSVPPFLPEDEIDEPVRAEPPSPATLRRRRAFRGVVGTVIGVVGLCAVAVVGKAIASRSPSATVPELPPVAQYTEAPAPRLSAALGGGKVDEPKREPGAVTPPEPAKAEAVAPAAPPEPAKADVPPVAADAPKTEEPAKAEEAPKPTGDAKELRKEALSLLNRGKLKDAIPVARAAIAADPTEAMGYLYLGTALQDTGKWKDGLEAYSECVRNATKGPVHECRAMGGKK